MLAQPDLRRGEVLEIEYRPAQGTRVLRGGQALGTDIPGADFNEAMLGIWLGEHPSDDKLKANLLGRSS